MNNPQFVTGEGNTDANISGTIKTTEAAQTVLTTLPYDEGWHIYLDRKEIEYRQTLDAVIAFDIADAGEHTLEFKYMPNVFVYGLIITALGTFAFISICVLDAIVKAKRRKAAIPAAEYTDELWVLEDIDTDAKEYLTTPKKSKEISDTKQLDDQETNENDN